MILLDTEKAYDTIWIYGLLYKLIIFKLPTYLLFTLKAFLEGRTFTVHLDEASSSPKATPVGLPQGAVLSSTLFALYISDIPHLPNTQLSLYADDTAILAQSWRRDTIVNRLTHATSVLLRYFTKWKLYVNMHKTEAIIFTRRRPVIAAPFRFQHTFIPWNTHVRYLGIILDSKLLFKRHINSVTHKASGTLLRLFPLLARDSTLTLTNKLTLYKLIIRSIFSYAAPVWSNTSFYNYRRLKVWQSKCLRVIGNYPRRTPIPFLHATLNIPPIREFIYSLTDKFFNRRPTHPNPLISSIGNYPLADLHCQYKKYLHKRPKHILL